MSARPRPTKQRELVIPPPRPSKRYTQALEANSLNLQIDKEALLAKCKLYRAQIEDLSRERARLLDRVREQQEQLNAFRRGR